MRCSIVVYFSSLLLRLFVVSVWLVLCLVSIVWCLLFMMMMMVLVGKFGVVLR